MEFQISSDFTSWNDFRAVLLYIVTFSESFRNVAKNDWRKWETKAVIFVNNSGRIKRRNRVSALRQKQLSRNKVTINISSLRDEEKYRARLSTRGNAPAAVLIRLVSCNPSETILDTFLDSLKQSSRSLVDLRVCVNSTKHWIHRGD